MGKVLIIAEKPSVAADIAKALGGFKKHDDYQENDAYVVASAVGHLVEISCPEEFEAKKGKWSLANLPVIPPHFDLNPIERSASKLRTLQKLIKRKDVEALVNACDAGREGELIFRNVVRYTRARQPIRRLWLQSMTPAAIRSGFEKLRSDEAMRPLADAAACRSEADWIVGINGTRAMTAFNSKGGGFNKTTVGRVQTPTLAILVEREEKIRKFIPRGYWELHATFQCAAGEYAGRWFDEKFSKAAGKEADEALRAERIWEQAQAEAIRAKCLGKPGVVSEESRPSTSLSPLLFDLTSLQRDANRRFGFSAKNTLSIAQALYEKHKVLTYPRTDSRHLPGEYLGVAKDALEAMNGTAYAGFSAAILREGWVRPNKRIFDDAKVSDHFAIIPTTLGPGHLTDAERKIYDMVVRRFLAVFYPAAEFLVTTRITRVEGEPFRSDGKVLVKPGWLEVYGKEADEGEGEGKTLVVVAPQESVRTGTLETRGTQTKPPPRYNEATLLGAMEGAGKTIEDEELREAMSERGLGTPATRAAIIEGLIGEVYVHRAGNELQATAKAFMLLALLRGLGVEELTKPELTGGWEFKLREMEHGRLSRPEFMAEIAEMTRHIVGRTKAFEGDEVPGDFGDLAVGCPKCGGLIKENYRRFQCQKCDFSLPKFLAGRLMEAAETERLITERQIGPLQGFRSKKGFPFASVLKLDAEQKLLFDFGEEKKDAEGAAAAVDFTGREPVGHCPKCGASVLDNAMNYVCEKAVGPARTCDFRTGTIILQQPIVREQAAKLLATRKTDLLDKFVSKRTGRAFKAFLVLDKENKVAFEFEKREPKAGAARAAREARPKIDFTGLQPIAQCPVCGGGVFETEQEYLCEKTQAEKRACRFKTGKVVCQRPVEREHLLKLISAGQTELLENFISKRGKPFSAHLAIGTEGKERGRVIFKFADSD
jgi:DNA topoisomerase-3